MSRIISGSWLDEYMKYTQNQESPDIFHKWCGISAVGAALERHVVMDMGEEGKRGAYQVRPNLFIILVADPAVCKKSTAMDLAYGVLTRMDKPVNIFAQKITTEALISRMSNTLEMEGTKVVHNSACMIFASELSVFLGSDAYAKGLVAVMIELYDCKKKWGYETKGGGTQELRNTWIHLLGATTPTWLKSGFPAESVGGGFTSRMVFVFSDSPRDKNPFPSIDYESRDKLVRDLNVIGKLRGEFKWSKGGRKWYRKWYEKQNIKKESRALLGYSTRRSVNLVKIAMILSVCEADDLVLEEKFLVESLNVLGEVEVDMEEAIKAIEKSAKGSNLDQVYDIITKAGTITRTKLMRSVSYKFSVVELDEILATMIEAKLIEEGEEKAKGSGMKGIRVAKTYSVVSGVGEEG